MIKIGQSVVDYTTLANQLQLNPTQQEIVERMAGSQVVFAFPTLHQLQFELQFRNNIVQSAKALNDSGVSFATFADARCNPAYWNLTDYGGFQLRRGVRPSDGILDIFRNGSDYAFECSTAIIIMYYRALLQTIGAQAFDQLFPTLLLFDGQYDEHLGVITQELSKTVMLPGDLLYFENPDYSPDTPEWSGENALYLGNGSFYGHGVGIMGAAEMIHELNTLRKPNASRSAYMIDQVGRPDFASLSRYSREPVL